MYEYMIPDRYNTENLKKVIQEPRRLKTEYDQLRNRFLIGTLTNILYNCESFMRKDWDNLIILDACRPDFFEDYNSFEGEYTRKISLGGTSDEFFIRNMKGKNFYDTVYVTGNTSVEYVDNSLYNIVKTYSDKNNYKPGWLPDVTLDAAIETYKKYPQKRLVVHFMQPHTPYLGENAEELRKKYQENKTLTSMNLGK
jgi:phosphoribosyl 1,2-cyclic phosphodiesterase